VNQTEKTFTCPLDCLHGVGEVYSGQYEPVMTGFEDDPVVLDIGANVGAFSLWALHRWPKAQVIAWEPNPTIFPYLKQNCSGLKVSTYPLAIGDQERPWIYPGKDTRLCSSQYQIGRQADQKIPVTVAHPAGICEADIVKIDTEGAEGYIVENLSFVPICLMVEWHSEELRRRVEAAVAGKMTLVKSQVLGIGYGIHQYMRHVS
jgi:FkbM family methyltransferase